MHEKEALLRQIPHVDKLMKHESIENSPAYRHELTDAVRDVLANLREKLLSGDIQIVPSDDELADTALERVQRYDRLGICRVINGTGVILHSNLGRACMSKNAAKVAFEAASSYCTLEYDVEKGKRGSRTGNAENYISKITESEASLIVNNNAAAVLLALTAFASGGNVLVSRGELVEIGGGFRVPDIISQCGATLYAVGTTNKTRLKDYKTAIDKDTKALLKVHTSNFKVVGFTEAVSIKELSQLGKEHNIPVIEDIGSGALIDVRRYGIHGEPFPAESLKSGADIVTFSGDKLLGGPQCGIIIGSMNYITKLKEHPLYRALRADKMTIAALEATLRVYADPIVAEREIPVLNMLSLTADELKCRAEKLCTEIEKHGGSASIVETKSVAGGGAMPGLELDSYAVAPVCNDGSTNNKISPKTIEQRLRSLKVPIIGHIVNDELLIDLRTIFEEDFDYIAEAIAKMTAG